MSVGLIIRNMLKETASRQMTIPQIMILKHGRLCKGVDNVHQKEMTHISSHLPHDAGTAMKTIMCHETAGFLHQ